VDVIVVGMPLAPYNTDELEPGLPCRIQALGMTFVDASEIDGIHAGMFVDEMHLDTKGAVLFSKALAKRLAKSIRRIAIANEAEDSHALLYHRY
jgi:lysophospholipase L1-like esterase